MSAPSGFVAFVESSSGYLAQTAFLLCGDRELARDLVQEALARTYAAWWRVKEPDALRYARRVLVNLHLDRVRQKAPVMDDLVELPGVDSGYDLVDDRDQVSLTLLDDQGEGQPVVGYPITVSGTDRPCFRSGAAMISRPKGFEFSLPLPTAEPGGAVVRDDGTVVGMYYGSDDDPHCAVPIEDVAEAVRDVERRKQTATTRVGPGGGLGIQLFGPDDTYPWVTGMDGLGILGPGVDLQPGDLLTRVGDTSLRKDDLTTLGPEGVIRMLTPGEKVTIEWESDGVPHRAKVEVRVGAQPHG